MSDAATEEVTQTPEQIAAAEEADFSKGFGVAPEKSAPAPEPEKKDDQTADPAKDDQQANTEVQNTTGTPAAPAEEDGPRIAGMTEAELRSSLAKINGFDEVKAALEAEVRKNFGQIGEVNRTLKELQSKLAAGGTRAARKFTAEDFKELSEELPGVAEAIAAGLSRVMGETEAAKEDAAAQAKPFDADAFFAEKIGPALEAVEARANEKAEQKIVRVMHPDFDQVVKTDEFGTWLATLPEQRRADVVTSPDAMVAGAAITEFKTWREKGVKTQTRNKNRLEQAVTPKGVAVPPGHQAEDPEAEFVRGFNSAH